MFRGLCLQETVWMGNTYPMGCIVGLLRQALSGQANTVPEIYN